MEIVYVKEKELFKVSKLSVGSVFRIPGETDGSIYVVIDDSFRHLKDDEIKDYVAVFCLNNSMIFTLDKDLRVEVLSVKALIED